MKVDPAELDPEDLQRLMIGAIVPRPIALVSTVAPTGQPNLAPFSFFNGVCADPPMVSISVGHRGSVPKDTLTNVRATGELTIATVTEELAEAMNLTSGEYPPDVSEWDRARLTPRTAQTVAPPHVAESPVNFECRVHQIIDLGTPPRGYGLILARIVHLAISPEVLDGVRIDPVKLRAIGRLGGRGYTRTRDRFEMTRPRVGERGG